MKLAVNEQKTQCQRCPEEAFEFLGYRIGRIHRRTGRGSYIGNRPSKASVQGMSRKISDMTARRYGQHSPEVVVQRLNRAMVGWANYFSLGHVGPAYSAISRHAVRRLRRWLGRKHKTKAGNYLRIPVTRLEQDYGLIRLTRQTVGLSSAKADLVRKPDAGNPHVRFDERGLETRPREPDLPGAKRRNSHRT